MPTIQRSTNSNIFCVPAALSALTGLHVDECVKLIREDLGDQPITGVYYSVILKILKKLGFQYRECGLKTQFIGTLVLVCFRGHVGIVDGLNYIDNKYPYGVSLENFKLTRVEKVFEVWK